MCGYKAVPEDERTCWLGEQVSRVLCQSLHTKNRSLNRSFWRRVFTHQCEWTSLVRTGRDQPQQQLQITVRP